MVPVKSMRAGTVGRVSYISPSLLLLLSHQNVPVTSEEDELLPNLFVAVHVYTPAMFTTRRLLVSESIIPFLVHVNVIGGVEPICRSHVMVAEVPVRHSGPNPT